MFAFGWDIRQLRPAQLRLSRNISEDADEHCNSRNECNPMPQGFPAKNRTEEETEVN